jgi:ABC-type multidrug transport system fused ATPase/permease subunit
VRLAGEVTAVANERVIRGVNQAIGGIKEIRTLRTEQHFLTEIGGATQECSTAQSGFQGLLILPKFLMEMALVFFVILFSMYVTWQGDGRESLVTILAMFGVAGIRILPALSQVSSSLVSMNYSSYALDKVYRDLFYAQAFAGKNEQINKKCPPASGFQTAELRDVRFAYEPNTRPTIDKVSLRIEKGQSIGFIGESGAGKTTLVDILLGLHRFDSGSFRVDGIDIDTYGWERWREHVAYIPQNAFLIDDTLERNVAFGLADKLINPSKVLDSVASAQLTALIDRLPLGLNTVLGERGIRLSGGERQRIALARAFYSGRDILILDEATSALDNDTERQVIEVIEGLRGKITLLVIAHRLTTVRSCDVIHRLEKGRIVASGRFEDVIRATAGAAP